MCHIVFAELGCHLNMRTNLIQGRGLELKLSSGKADGCDEDGGAHFRAGQKTLDEPDFFLVPGSVQRAKTPAAAVHSVSAGIDTRGP